MTIQQVPQDQWSLGDNYERIYRAVEQAGRAPVRSWLAFRLCCAGLTSAAGRSADAGDPQDCAPASVLGIDPSAGFIALARGQVNDARASFQSGAAQALRSRARASMPWSAASCSTHTRSSGVAG